MTSKNFIKSILKDVSDALNVADVNREFKQVSRLDAVRIDVSYEDMQEIHTDKPSIRATFNSILGNKKEKLNTIKHLEKYLKDLKNQIKEEE